ncbi:MAG: hypothetical protein JXQ73_09775 [Phycisphaerae bacterium]|nr:hypothetical protein [Phycisphaerae bacterium]
MKRIIQLVVGLVIVVILVVAGVFIWIDSIAKAGVEKGGTFALGVPTKLDSMDVGVVTGKVEMSGLDVANPSGYETPHFLHLGDGRVAVSLGTLMDDKVVLPELTLSKVSVNLEKRGDKANYQAIMDGLKKFESKGKAKEETKPKDQAPAKEQAPAAKEGEGKKFVIQRVLIEDVDVQVDLLPLGGKLTRVPVKIEKIELKDVGTGSAEGVHMAELTSIIMKAILTAVAKSAGGVLPGNIAAELTTGLKGLEELGAGSLQVVGEVTAKIDGEVKKVAEVGKAAVEGLGQEGKKAQEAAQTAVKQVDEGAKQVGKEADKAVKDAGKKLEEGLGGLLGGKKDEKKK